MNYGFQWSACWGFTKQSRFEGFPIVVCLIPSLTVGLDDSQDVNLHFTFSPLTVLLPEINSSICLTSRSRTERSRLPVKWPPRVWRTDWFYWDGGRGETRRPTAEHRADTPQSSPAGKRDTAEVIHGAVGAQQSSRGSFPDVRQLSHGLWRLPHKNRPSKDIYSEWGATRWNRH